MTLVCNFGREFTCSIKDKTATDARTGGKFRCCSPPGLSLNHAVY